jgi:hypothetical protein
MPSTLVRIAPFAVVAVVACAPQSPQVLAVESPPSPSSTAPDPRAAGTGRDSGGAAMGDFFLPDPPLDGLELTNEVWSFRQETWSGAGEAQQHCREVAYPARLRDQILREANELIVRHGFTGGLPATQRKHPLVVAFDDFTPSVTALAEPLVKVVCCTEGVAPRTERDRFVDGLKMYPRTPHLPFGEPDLAWRRIYREGTEEFGFRWSKVNASDVTAALSSSGFVEDVNAGLWRHVEEQMQARLRGDAVWWSGVR